MAQHPRTVKLNGKLLNTSGMSFLNLDWTNKSAEGVVCSECGYLHPFMPVGGGPRWRLEWA